MAAVEGDWLVALTQRSGRGRQGRAWVSQSGNFFGSTVVELQPGDPPAPSLSLVAGLALIEALDVAAPGQPLMLKWPNDVMLGGAKLAGILLERAGNCVVAGFGVNLANAPALADRQVVALSGELVPAAFAPLLAASFTRLLHAWRLSDIAALVRAWEVRAHPAGTPLAVHDSAGEKLRGRFAGLEPDGALRLLRDDGRTEVVRAGDVEL